MEKSNRKDNIDETMVMKENELNSNILIDFFLTVGLPKNIVSKLLNDIVNKFKGNFKDEETFKFVQDELMKQEVVAKLDKEMIINLYPDCLSKKMSDSDPRKGFLDKNKIREFPKYAFPLGYHPKFEIK
jgi:hypothetical protein|tara:strand:+ start:97 stop:483 length:387 start_codon:yes stop_codon:yes gene_type:complete